MSGMWEKVTVTAENRLLFDRDRVLMQAELGSRRYTIKIIAAGPHRPGAGNASRGRRRRLWRRREFLVIRDSFNDIQRRWACREAREAGKREAHLIWMHEA